MHPTICDNGFERFERQFVASRIGWSRIRVWDRAFHQSIKITSARGRLDRFLWTRRPNLNSCSCTGRALAVIGWILLIFMAVSLATMPVTQHLWTWDHFLHGGRDFELGVLMVLSLLSLALVLAKASKQCIQAFFCPCCSVANTVTQKARLLAACSPFRVYSASCPASGFCSLPLQI